MPNPFDKFDKPQQQGVYPVGAADPTRPYDIAIKGHAAASTAYDEALKKEELRGKRITNNSAEAASEAGLDPKTVDFLARQWLLTGQLPPLGMGKQAAQSRQQILNHATEVAGASGKTPEQAQVAFARYRNTAAALKQQEQNLAGIRGNEQGALANLHQYIDRSQELPLQTRFSPVNSVTQFLLRKTGNPTIAQMDTARQNASSEMGKVLVGTPSGGGTLSDSARMEMLNTLSGPAAIEQKRGMEAQFKTDMDNRVNALQNQIDQGYGRLGGGNPQATGLPGSVPIPGQNAASVGGALPPPLPGINGGPSAPPPSGPGGPGGGPAGGGPQMGVATGKYRNVLDPVTNNALNQFLAQRKDPAYINAFLQSHGADPIPEASIHKLYDWANSNPQYKGPLGEATKSVPLTTMQQISSSPLATGIASSASSMMMGGMDELGGGVSALFGGDYAKTRDTIDANRRALALTNPKSAFIGDMVGTGASFLAPELALGKLGLGARAAGMFGKRAIVTDLGMGATRGALENNDNRLLGAGEGAAGYAVGGMLGRGAAVPLAALGRSRFATATGNALRGAFGKDPIMPPPPLSSGDSAIANAALRAGPEDITNRLQQAAGLNVPMSLADTHPQLTSLAGAAVRRSPDADAAAQAAFLPRARGQVDRLGTAINRDLGPTANIPQLSEDLSAQAATAAGPLYKDAFQGGSIAPLQAQFGHAFGESSAEVTAARRALADAQRQMTLAGAETSRAGNNVYGASGAARATQEAKAAVDAAQQRVAAAEAAHNSNLGRLRQAQSDGSANAPGAVWSPRIQQFLDDPIMKDGLQRGLAVQRIEAVAKGEKFNPKEYAVTGTDGAGQPVVGSVPNMRLLDAGKRGLDSIIAENTDPVTGKVSEYGRSVTQFKQAYLSHLDEINPTYGAARAAYGGPMQSREALQFGQDAHTMDPNSLGVALNRRSPEQLGQSQLGFQDALNQHAQKLRYSGNPWSALDTPQMEQRLATMYPGSHGVPNLLQQRDMETGLARSTNDILGNSKTAQRGIADSSFAESGLPQLAMDAGLMAAGHVPVATIAKKMSGNGLRDLANFGLGQRAVAKADAIAPTLFNTDPQAASGALADILARREAMNKAIQASRGSVANGWGPFGSSQLGSALLGQYAQ